ncbi:uncharacterized protein [Leptinotarsa decemlineata]|uniref:uncharacterized protein n=1 Tax=Leptinotarsa decemlineata TaxID=7539 RepID=UPI000C255588|nr:uncharacterized protein LOC111515936 [Leptinotarsa decemlineata]
MFTLPPRPPKDYVLKDITKSLCSSSQFTPDSLPRVTQDNLGKFCSPIEYEDNELPEKITIDIQPTVMEKMTNDARACWVVQPGKDDFFLHDVYKKYSVNQDRANYDPRYMHKEKVFNRSYQFELDCIEAARLEKLRVKCEREDADFENSFQRLVTNQKAKEKPAIQVKTCKEEPPFWWKKSNIEGECDVVEQPKTETFSDDLVGTTSYRSSYVRWQEEPNLTAFVQDDPCRRKRDMLLVGQPFKTEACNWYYKTYPPPEFKFRPKKFT